MPQQQQVGKKYGSPKCWKNTDHISLWILEMPKFRCRSAAIFSVPVWYWISARSLLKSDFTPDVNRADFQHGRYPWMMEHITRTIGSCVAVIDEWLLRSWAASWSSYAATSRRHSRRLSQRACCTMLRFEGTVRAGARGLCAEKRLGPWSRTSASVEEHCTVLSARGGWQYWK